MTRIVITDQNFGDDARIEREIAAAAGAELIVLACRTEADVAEALAVHRPHVLLVQFVPVGARALQAANGLTGVVRCGVGLDNVDTRAAAAGGIAVASVPDYCVDEVADHALALLLAVERRIVELARQTREGGWDFRVARPVRRLRGLTLGLVGFGRIGRAVAHRGAALGLRPLAFDPLVTEAEAASLEELLPRADVLSLHVPLTEETRGLIGRRELALLPGGAVVLNTSRGGLLDEAALADALAEGRLRGAGLDVLADEPPAPDHPLRTAANVVLTPHAAWYSDAAIEELRRRAIETALELAHK
jgi:D-3-phosphoglycerate dehydrogenase